MKPYYEHAGITIYHGDCLAVMDELRGHFGERPFDLLLTDPPYGLKQGRKSARGGSGASLQMTGFLAGKRRPAMPDYGVDSQWDDDLAPEAIATARSFSSRQIIFGGNYYDLPATRCWLVWNKENQGTDFADCELAWTNLDKAVRMLTYRWNGMLQEPGCERTFREHPTQKPEAVMRWALMMAPAEVKTVFDPFMGSGTTLVAAKRLGRQCVGIEREERYCEIAVKRLAQEALDFGVSA